MYLKPGIDIHVHLQSSHLLFRTVQDPVVMGCAIFIMRVAHALRYHVFY